MPVVAADLRQTERQELRLAALVRVVGGSSEALQGKILNLSEGGTQIRVDRPLSPFTLVKVEYDDNLLLGEVVYCEQKGSGWLIGLRIEHGLFGLTALARAMQAF